MKNTRELSVKSVRGDFSFFRNQKKLAYLDNSATTQRPDVVMQAVTDFYQTINSNPLRGLYDISIQATDAYERARSKVADFIGAKDPSEIIFTKNATESLNLVASSLGDLLIEAGDEIVISIAEHHSNMLPWRFAAKRHSATVRYIEPDEYGDISEETFVNALSEKTKIVAITQVSNVFGRKYDIKRFAQLAHERDIVIVADGAQSVPHMPVDVDDLDVDFLAFSGHKMMGPMGIGVLYGKEKWLKAMPPYITGGEMIELVSLDHITYADIPHKFEAGTVNAGGAVGLSAAIDYIESFGFDQIMKREDDLTHYAYEKMSAIDGIYILGSKDASDHHGILTFTLDGVHPHDIAYILSDEDIAIRAGHHCAQPLLKYMKTPSTARASISFYNTEDEIDRLVDALGSLREKMGY